jgi:transcriptional regulator with XRE-family HTH domain
MDLNGLFVRNMKAWRKNRGISQKTLSERCQAAHTYIRQIESGSRTPSFAFIVKLAEALDINAYQLFYDETMADDENPSQTAYIGSLKTAFLEKMAGELDAVIEKMRK